MNLWPVEHFFEHVCHHFWVGLLLHPPKSDDLEYLSTPTYRFRLIKIFIKEKIVLQKVVKTFK